MKLVRIWLRCFAIASLAVGPLAGMFAIGFMVHTFNFIRHASQAEGTITKLTAYRENDNTEMFAPTFTFATTTGTITKESSLHSSPPSFAVGEHVPVLFDPNDAHHSEIATTGQLWFVPLLLGAFFVIFTAVGILLLHRPQIASAPLPFWTDTTNA